MAYVLTAEEFFGRINEQSTEYNKVEEYLNSVPQSVWQAFEKFDQSLEFFQPFTRNHTDEEVLEHQLFLCGLLESVPNILQREDRLTRMGYDTIALRLNESYMNQVELINEGALSSIWNFLASLTKDENGEFSWVNFIRLILDVIGLIPFEWAGIPIDTIANTLSCLISLAKGDWFSAVLSGIAIVDATKAATWSTRWLGKAAPLINKIIPVLCRSGNVAKADVMILREGLIKLGDKGMVGGVSHIFEMFGTFLLGTVTSIIKTAKNFVVKLFGGFPIIGKHLNTASKAVDVMLSKMSFYGKNFQEASRLLATDAEKEVAKASTPTVGFASHTAAGAAKPVEKGASTHLTGGEYVKTLQDEIKASKEYDQIPAALKPQYVAAKTENTLLGEVNQAAQKAIKGDKALQDILVSKGWAPTQTVLTMARAGDESALRAGLTEIVKNPSLMKNLSKAEAELIGQFAKKPEALIAGMKHFSDSEKVLTAIFKASNVKIAKQYHPMRRLLLLITKLMWEKYGSFKCATQAVIGKERMDTIKSTMSLAKAATSGSPATNEHFIELFEEEETYSNVDISKIENENPEAVKLVNDEVAKQKKTDKELKRKSPCSDEAGLIQAKAGLHFPGSSVAMGLDGMGKYTPDQSGVDAYSNQVLKGMNEAPLELQHPLEATDPTAAVYFADVYDFDKDQVSLNTTDQSRGDEYLKKMVEAGKITQEQADQIKADVQAHIENGTYPESIDTVEFKKNTEASQEEPATQNESRLFVKGLINKANKK